MLNNWNAQEILLEKEAYLQIQYYSKFYILDAK